MAENSYVDDPDATPQAKVKVLPTLAQGSSEPIYYQIQLARHVTAPLTVAFVGVGLSAAAQVIIALLTAVLSATNSCFYTSLWTLLSLTKEGCPPGIFGRVNCRWVPLHTLASINLINNEDRATFPDDIGRRGRFHLVPKPNGYIRSAGSRICCCFGYFDVC